MLLYPMFAYAYYLKMGYQDKGHLFPVSKYYKQLPKSCGKSFWAEFKNLFAFGKQEVRCRPRKMLKNKPRNPTQKPN